MSSQGKELKQGLIAIGIGLLIVAAIFMVLQPKSVLKEGGPNGGDVSAQQEEPAVHKANSDREGKPTWLNYDGKYQLWYDDKKIDGTNRIMVEEDLLVYDPVAGRNFLFEDFTLLDDSTLRIAREMERGGIPLWRVKDGRFWLYLEGEQITNVKTFKSRDDLVATDIDTGVRYRMKDFYVLNDNTLRLAQPI